MKFFFRILIILSIMSLTLGLFSFSKEVKAKIPENFGEAGRRMSDVIKELPQAIKRIWREEVLPIWQKMADWFRLNIWSKMGGGKEIQTETEKEIEKRKTSISEEWGKEKRELSQDLEKFKQWISEKLKIKEFKEFIRQK